MNVVAFAALLLATTTYALLRGGGPERWTAGLYLLAAAATIADYTALAQRFGRVESHVAAVDILMLAGLAAILVRADRFWPMAAFAAQGVAVLSHVVKLIDPSIVRRAYAIALAVPSWLAVLVLLVGAVRHTRRTACNGPERDWS